MAGGAEGSECIQEAGTAIGDGSNGERVRATSECQEFQSSVGKRISNHGSPITFSRLKNPFSKELIFAIFRASDAPHEIEKIIEQQLREHRL